MFKNEPGGHRWQRIPPTEKRGRVQTSTVTVAVLREPTPQELVIPDKDLEISTCRGSGAGGQAVNKTSFAVQIKHLPSGLQVRCESDRSQLRNKDIALSMLRAKLLQIREEADTASANSSRRGQIGCGARGDKRRTIAVQRGEVVDHITGKSCDMKRYLQGQVDLLW